MTTFAAQALVVSLGLDTFAGDPISGFTLRSEDYLRVGVKPVNVLEGFEQQAG